MGKIRPSVGETLEFQWEKTILRLQTSVLLIEHRISQIAHQPRNLPGVTICSISWTVLERLWRTGFHACTLGDFSQFELIAFASTFGFCRGLSQNFFRLIFACELPNFWLARWTDHPSKPVPGRERQRGHPKRKARTLHNLVH